MKKRTEENTIAGQKPSGSSGSKARGFPRPTAVILICFPCSLSLLLLALSIFYSSEKPNVVVISIDTLRPDHLGYNGHDRATSPALDRLAAEGVVFEDAVSTTSWTLPAHGALLTGMPDQVHGLSWDMDVLHPEVKTLAEVMKKAGYDTYGVFTAPYLLPQFGFGRGFDEYVNAVDYETPRNRAETIFQPYVNDSTPVAMDEVERLLDRNGEENFFLFLHLYDVHPPFDPPSPYDELFDPACRGDLDSTDIMGSPEKFKEVSSCDLEFLKARYDGSIRYVDEHGIQRLVDILEDREILDETIIVVTSDHGEEFAEHGSLGHRHNLHDATLRIPLVIWAPGMAPAGKRIEGQARIFDVMPTILEMAGIRTPPELVGASLCRRWKREGAGKDIERPLLAELFDRYTNRQAYRTDQWKMMTNKVSGETKLYYLEQDPLEQNPITDPRLPVFEMNAKRMKKLESRILKHRIPRKRAEKPGPHIDKRDIEMISALGYLIKK